MRKGFFVAFAATLLMMGSIAAAQNNLINSDELSKWWDAATILLRNFNGNASFSAVNTSTMCNATSCWANTPGGGGGGAPDSSYMQYQFWNSTNISYVPYTGATEDVDLGVYDINAERGNFEDAGLGFTYKAFMGGYGFTGGYFETNETLVLLSANGEGGYFQDSSGNTVSLARPDIAMEVTGNTTMTGNLNVIGQVNASIFNGAWNGSSAIITNDTAARLSYLNVTGNSIASSQLINSTSGIRINSSDGNMTIQDMGGDGNSIIIDFRRAANAIAWYSLENIFSFYVPFYAFNGLYMGDASPIRIGNSGQDALLTWDINGNDHLTLRMRTGSAAQSGYFIIKEYGDGHYPATTTVNPTLRIFADTADDTAFLQLYHDATNANIEAGKGIVQILNSTGDGAISAADFIDKTSVYDTSKSGPALSYAKPASSYTITDPKTSATSINHSAFYGYTKYSVTDTSKPVNTTTWEEVCEFSEKEGSSVCKDDWVTKTSYPYTKQEEGVSLSQEIALLRQQIYELSEKVKALEAKQ